MPGPLRTLTLIVRIPFIRSGVAVNVGGKGVTVGVIDRVGVGEGEKVADGKGLDSGALQEAALITSKTHHNESFFIARIVMLLD
jgi:hypothetical protein